MITYKANIYSAEKESIGHPKW